VPLTRSAWHLSKPTPESEQILVVRAAKMKRNSGQTVRRFSGLTCGFAWAHNRITARMMAGQRAVINGGPTAEPPLDTGAAPKGIPLNHSHLALSMRTNEVLLSPSTNRCLRGGCPRGGESDGPCALPSHSCILRVDPLRVPHQAKGEQRWACIPEHTMPLQSSHPSVEKVSILGHRPSVAVHNNREESTARGTGVFCEYPMILPRHPRPR
jgi:hypothetical protein